MKVKPAEIAMGIIFIGIGMMGMGEKELFHYDVPILYPKVFSALCIAVGIVWLVVPCFLRSRNKKQQGKAPDGTHCRGLYPIRKEPEKR